MSYRETELALLFAQVEDSLAALYGACASRFSRDYDLWHNLAEDEREHARVAQRFAEAAERGEFFFKDRRAKEFLLKSTLAYVRDIRNAVESGTLDGPGVLRLALSIEESIVERGLFTQFVSGDEDVIEALARLGKETSRHAWAIRTVLAKRERVVALPQAGSPLRRSGARQEPPQAPSPKSPPPSRQ